MFWFWLNLLALFANLPKQTLTVPSVWHGGVDSWDLSSRQDYLGCCSLAQDTHGPVFPCFSSWLRRQWMARHGRVYSAAMSYLSAPTLQSFHSSVSRLFQWNCDHVADQICRCPFWSKQVRQVEPGSVPRVVRRSSNFDWLNLFSGDFWSFKEISDM